MGGERSCTLGAAGCRAASRYSSTYYQCECSTMDESIVDVPGIQYRNLEKARHRHEIDNDLSR